MTSDSIPPRGLKTPTLATIDDRNDTSRFCVQSNQPSPALLNATGHTLLRSIVAGQSDQLLAAATAIGRLERMLPNPSAEARLVATLMAISSDHPSPPVVAAPSPTSSPARPTRKSRTSKPAKQKRQSKPAHPRMDSSGKLLSSREIGGVAVVSQAEARKALGMSCIQMLKLENQKLLGRIQEPSSRLVYYAVAEVQRLFDLIDKPTPEATEAENDATDGAA